MSGVVAREYILIFNIEKLRRILILNVAYVKPKVQLIDWVYTGEADAPRHTSCVKDQTD